jgi:hypothetical protein
MITPPPQRLRLLPGTFVVERLPEGAAAGDGWVALVRAPDGLTVVRAAGPCDSGERWAALYGEESGHDLDVPGMLAAIVSPLASAAIPVFVASTFRADLVFVPVERVAASAAALRVAGHHVEVPADLS